MGRTMMSADNRKPSVLVVDDDTKLLKLISILLERAGWHAHTAESGQAALRECDRAQPDAVITDMRMDGMSGMALFEALRSRYPTLPVVILTAHGTIPDAVEATQSGVFAYLTKPFDSEELLRVLERARQLGQRSGAPETAQDQPEHDWCREIVTSNASMRALLAQARRVAQSDANVLIQGASGTGKEMLAKAMHRASRRRAAPFVAVNCTAIPEGLFESEFFGHRKGAFTGATESRDGLIVAAQHGTLLLDEIGDMPVHFQAKLLRVLQDREVRPVGSNVAVPFDVRIISATHEDLEKAVAEKRFREDLYYRLNVVTLEIPPLSRRPEDVPLLADHFMRETLKDEQMDQVRGFSREAMELLMSAPWPGNIRQLRNVVEQCVVLSPAPIISAELVQRALRGKSSKLLPFAEARDRFEFDYLVQLLQTTRGNVTHAARIAERNRSEFYSLLKKHRLDPESFRDDS
jgi:two-component system response regulator GlrR